MSEATTHDCGDRLVERRVGAKRRPVGADRFGRLVRHQGMRAFGLALKSESDRKCLDEREPEVDERSRRARFELELDLRGRRAPLAGEQEPRVEGDLDRRAVRLDRPGRPADLRAESRASGFAPVRSVISRAIEPPNRVRSGLPDGAATSVSSRSKAPDPPGPPA